LVLIKSAPTIIADALARRLIMSLQLVDPCGWLKGRSGKPELIATLGINC
jgi:hypothetical protein